ncbi:hypothetical protein [Chitinimonas sp. BJB300]|uniref:hypothetical protein n=1 Tax=Chitinimonas sp. BJB300 TaxID=1559339 RepID=UPI00116D4333|nr:hypothetical protein [Chitinimonas sp. BJB300]TSJ85302.1 hypothetical protein FG002_017980 [Chitinimonas sp. BJB300]
MNIRKGQVKCCGAANLIHEVEVSSNPGSRKNQMAISAAGGKKIECFNALCLIGGDASQRLTRALLRRI